MDESIRELERGAPDDDTGRRLDLLEALARVGRTNEALAALDLARIPGPWFPRAKELSEKLWADAITRLEPGITVPLGWKADWVLAGSGEVVAHQEEQFGATNVTELATGELVHVIAPRRPGPWAEVHESKSLLSLADRIISADTREIVSLEWDGHRIIEERHVFEVDSFDLLSVSPALDRVLLDDFARVESDIPGMERFGVYRFPSLEPVLERRERLGEAVVDWSTRHLVCQDERGLVRAFPFDGGAPSSLALELDIEDTLVALRPGVLLCETLGVALHEIHGAWTLPLVESCRQLDAPSASSDGRGVRLVADGTPVRFDVDFATGCLDAKRKGARQLARGWHPHADICSVRIDDDDRTELRTLDGRILRNIAGGPPVWSRDGRVAVSRERTDTLRVWKTRL